MKKNPIKNLVFRESFFNFKKYIGVLGYRTTKKEVYFPEYVKEFLAFVEKKGVEVLTHITSREIQQYHIYIHQRPNKYTGNPLYDKTIQQHMYALGLYFDFLLNIEAIQELPFVFPKFVHAPHQPREVLSMDEVLELYGACNSLIDKAVLTLAYGCGLRRNEIYSLNLNDIYIRQSMVVVRNGKRGKTRSIPLTESGKNDLKNYIHHERQIWVEAITQYNNPALLISKQGQRLSGDEINSRVKAIVARCKSRYINCRQITLHCLRHSIATHMIENGAGIEFVRDFLGHAGIDTTNIYVIKRKQRTALQKQLL